MPEALYKKKKNMLGNEWSDLTCPSLPLSQVPPVIFSTKYGDHWVFSRWSQLLVGVMVLSFGYHLTLRSGLIILDAVFGKGVFFPFPMLPVNKVPKKNLISKKNGTDRRLTKPENFLCNNNKYGKALDKGSVMGVLHREQRKDLFLFSSLCASLPPHFYLVWGPALSAS